VDAAVSALSDYPEFVPVVARWHWQEWGHTDPGGTLAAWTAGLARQAGADRIPGTLVAVAERAPVGAVCLVEGDMPGHEAVAGLSPWIKGLYVDQPARHQGYGALLMSRCETWAAALGHEVLYLYTERGSGAEQLYKRLGWQIIRHDQYDGIAVSVMRKHLDQAAGSSAPRPRYHA
jgi:GNAT superfamily N-acetyltransferase